MELGALAGDEVWAGSLEGQAEGATMSSCLSSLREREKVQPKGKLASQEGESASREGGGASRGGDSTL